MRLDRLPEYFLSAVVTILGLVFALYAGSQIGSGNTRNLMMIGAGCAYILVGLLFKERIWILAFLCWICTGRFLSTPLSLHDAAILLSFSWFLIFKAFKLIKNKPVHGWIDVLVALNLIYVGTMFIRNPTGGLVLDSDIIGGRPYLSVAIAVLAYWVLVRADLSPKLAGRLPYLWFLAFVLPTLFSIISFFVPALVMPLARIYAGIDLVGELNLSADEGSTRLGFLGGIGAYLFLVLACKYRPSTIFNPIYFGRFLLMLLACLMILLSGFRSVMISAGVMLIMAGLYQGRKGELIKLAVIGVPILGLLIAMQGTLLQLPFPVQRSLSFLPGKWDERAVTDAEMSSEWRYEMWRWMWNEEKYLKNWWLGDGFGYSQEVLNQNLAAVARGDYSAVQEGFLITGRVHSGPLSALRFSGYIGFALFLLLSLAITRMAHRMVLRTRGTPYGFAVLVICLPMITFLPFYIFVFGAYEIDLATLIFYVGVLKLLERSFNRYLEEKASEQLENAKEMPELMDARPNLLAR
jgi:hypothetical protein